MLFKPRFLTGLGLRVCSRVVQLGGWVQGVQAIFASSVLSCGFGFRD